MRILCLLGAMLFCIAQTTVYAQNKEEMIAIWQSEQNANPPEVRAAACAPATALRDLEWNNVRALITTNGALWHDRSVSRGSYEVPKGEGVSVMYGGALWMGGLSPDQQLKIAAMRYGNSGSDFWTGPLTNDGTAEIDENVCAEYDQFYMSLRSDAVLHRQYFDCLADPTCDLQTQGLDTYTIPAYFQNYPATGNVALGQDYYLAPFLDYNENGVYDPSQGDYPWYDFIQEIDCAERRREDRVPLFGDQTLFWIGNDKGNIHSESQGEPIGMEIRAQAFAFSTNDEINNMTFYNFVLINQGTQTLTETYFGTWIDCDIGGFPDDYVGCDVQRGLGYAYNGDAFDDPTGISLGYGANPPAMGVDFFEGPYQDSDDVDNPLSEDFQEAQDLLGIPYEGIGIGYGDNIVDNERFGMRKFLYHNFGGGINGLPELPLEHYNYLKGFWKNGQRMAYGGDALNPNTGADLAIDADYMFPGDTDPLNWGTQGQGVEPWTEQSADNPAGDRLFMQSAGPFTLQPGDYNNITVGVLYARASAGDPFASVELLRVADDKAQALFDNCFEIVSGPDAPDVTIQEMENELILYLSNENGLSNNFNEEYITVDPEIPTIAFDGTPLTDEDRSYKFQGYLVYQVADETVSPTELEDPEKARLIHTVDIEDDVDVVINYDFDPDMELSVPKLMAEGPNEGVQHSFRVTDDQFASGDSKLINHKTYYFMILAYGYNNYEEFNPNAGTGQDVQFKASRSGAGGTSIRTYAGIPHSISPEAGGTIAGAAYGDGIEITRIEGRGNNGNDLALTAASETEVLENTFVNQLTYQAGGGPVNIKIIDPLNVPSAEFDLRLAVEDERLDTAKWVLTNLTMLEDSDPSNDDRAVYTSKKSIETLNEDLLLDWGMSISWQQYAYPNGDFTEPISATITFADPGNPWFTGIPDGEGFTPINWIRSGTQDSDDDIEEEVIFDDLKPGSPLDEEELYENLLGGTWAPYMLASYTAEYTNSVTQETQIGPSVAPTNDQLKGDLSVFSRINSINNVDIVLTSDKSKWTRCGVLEMQPLEDLAQDLIGTDFGDFDDSPKMILRRHPSVDKLGRTVAEGADPAEATLNGAQPIGMSWFPGYAIDLGTGERLNMAFGEDSWLSADNGNDMIFNPSDRVFSNIGGTVYAGGQHWIYVFKNSRSEEFNDTRMPAYDAGQHLFESLETNFTVTNQRNRVFRSCTWVGSSLVNEGYEMLSVEDGLIPNDVRISLRVNKEYDKYSPISADLDDTSLATNHWNPWYTFSTSKVATVTSNETVLEENLKEINVVPNPYFAYSQYEDGKLDNRVKFTNLPEVCTIRIYTLSGLLVRTFEKASPLTSLDWDLKNERNVPVASGVHIIHIEVPGVGERILKWFGVMRPIDLDNF
ncbi:MAG: T9SS C-terminal target domain-containing protein [Flavobacteriales bacterium]|nr:T9SS C-terminal target domain-containing protein [Flavobacteriales bacterium]